jgi:hypothetical protein
MGDADDYYPVLPETTPNSQLIADGKKYKVDPRTGRGGPEGEQRYSSNVSLTSAQDGNDCPMSLLSTYPAQNCYTGYRPFCVAAVRRLVQTFLRK